MRSDHRAEDGAQNHPVGVLVFALHGVGQRSHGRADQRAHGHADEQRERDVSQRAGTEVLYQTADEFVRACVEALAIGELEAFRQAYDRADALLIDDVHAIAARPDVQAEFAVVFRSLVVRGAQVMLTSRPAWAAGFAKAVERNWIKRETQRHELANRLLEQLPERLTNMEMTMGEGLLICSALLTDLEPDEAADVIAYILSLGAPPARCSLHQPR